MTKPFPVIWYRDNEAGFYVGQHLVRVPLKFMSNDLRQHVMPWLVRLWPFHVTTIRDVPQLAKKIDGEKVLLHKLYAQLLHGDCVVEANDGNFLNWTVENIGPRKKPDELATPAQQTKEVHNRMFVFENAWDAKGRPLVEWIARVIKKDRAQFTRMMIEQGIITKDNGTSAQTLAVMLQTEVERKIAASMTRRDVDAQRTEDHLETELPYPDLVAETRPDLHPDGVTHKKPAPSTRKAAIETEPRPERRWGATEYDVDPYDHSFKQRKRPRRLPPTTSDYLRRVTFTLQGPSMRNDHGLPLACLCSACLENRLHPNLPRLRCSSYHKQNGQAPPASMPYDYVYPYPESEKG
jgi:hypothetical protein